MNKVNEQLYSTSASLHLALITELPAAHNELCMQATAFRGGELAQEIDSRKDGVEGWEV
jgi:hypothetical protein